MPPGSAARRSGASQPHANESHRRAAVEGRGLHRDRRVAVAARGRVGEVRRWPRSRCCTRPIGCAPSVHVSRLEGAAKGRFRARARSHRGGTGVSGRDGRGPSSSKCARPLRGGAGPAAVRCRRARASARRRHARGAVERGPRTRQNGERALVTSLLLTPASQLRPHPALQIRRDHPAVR